MRQMKESGLEWIGEIPYDWSITKIKFILSNENDSLKVGPFGSQLSGSDLVSEGYWVYSQRSVLDRDFEHNAMFISKDKFDSMKGFHVRANDILITTRGTIGKICRVPKSFSEGILHPCIIKFRIDEDKYSYKLLELIFNHSGILQKQLNFLSNATTIEVIYSGTLKNLQIPFPPLAEQKKIADFLDEKCGEIDLIKADVQRQIELLNDYKKSVITEAVTKGLNPKAKLKDSCVKWIGKIPEHWKVEKGKYLLQYMQKPVRADDGVITCFRDGEVTLRSNRREDGFTMADKEIGYQGIDVGDLVVHGMDGFAGSIGISDSRGKASPVLNVLDSKQNKRFLMYYLRSMAYSNVFVAIATGIRVRSCDLRWNKLAELLYPVPSLDEQNEIVRYIDSTLSQTDQIIADKQKQLETLDEYKKSLIFEYVTGKKEVAQ